jgi:MFS superfamily sulfate permease-like transporter
MANSDVAPAAHKLLLILDWMPGYRRDWPLPDVLADLPLLAVMVPEGMAYAGIIGVPPIMGLWRLWTPTCWIFMPRRADGARARPCKGG